MTPLSDPRPARRPPRVAALAAAVVLAACGGTAPAPAPAPLPSEVEWVASVMKESYLYADRVPAVELSSLTTPEETLEALRVNPPDRYSYLDRRSVYDQFFDEGRALGLGIGFRIEGDAIVLRMVQPDSPAGRAGLARGDRLAAIDGVPAATLVAQRRVSAAFGPSEPGLSVRLAVDRGATPRFERQVVKDWYPVAPVLAQRVLVHDGVPVGYVALYSFTEPARQAWDDAIAAIRAAGARRLVVDLRDNGGGRLFVAAAIGASVAPAGTIGQPFVRLRHGPGQSANDLTIPLPAHPATGGFERIAWLVSEVSCSASESLIAGLRPYRADALIGTITCGKPVGFSPQTRGDRVLSAVTFETVDRDGVGGWYEGLRPTCTVVDDPGLPLGDARDPRLAAALGWLAGGTCPTPAADAAAPKAAPRVVTEPARGLASETGLY